MKRKAFGAIAAVIAALSIEGACVFALENTAERAWINECLSIHELCFAAQSLRKTQAPLTLSAAGKTPKKRTIADDVGIDQKLGERIPLDLKFTDESGKPVVLGDYFRDKPVILTCVYYRCPMLCTQVLNGVLKSAQGLNLRMDADYTVLSVSIDPRETAKQAAEKKKNYVREYRREGAEAGWHFLTGKAEAIAALTKAVGFRYRYDASSDQFAHASGIVVLTPDGKISRYFYGIDYHPRDLQLGLVESSKRRIGTAVDQVLLLCFHYDPVTGRYGLAIAAVLRGAGIATLLVMGTFLFRMFRLERRRIAAVRIAAVRSPTSDL